MTTRTSPQRRSTATHPPPAATERPSSGRRLTRTRGTHLIAVEALARTICAITSRRPFTASTTLAESRRPCRPNSTRVPGTSSRRRRRSASPSPSPQRSTDISHAPYHRPSSPHRDRYREHHRRVRGDSSRSPRFQSGHQASSPSSDFAKRSRLEASREGSASSGSLRRGR